MSLSSADKKYVAKREKRVKYWPFYGGASLVLLIAYGVWLWVKVPHLINPWHVIESVQAGTLPESTMGVMALMLPIVMAALLLFAFVVVLFWFIVFYNERRLIRLVRKLEAGSEENKG